MSLIKSYTSEGCKKDGDMFLIRHNKDFLTVIDCNLPSDDDAAAGIVDSICRLSRTVDEHVFISTHPHSDHLEGLDKLEQDWGIDKFYHIGAEVDRYKLSPYHRLTHGKAKAEDIVLTRGETYAGVLIHWPDRENEEFANALEKAEKDLNRMKSLAESLQDRDATTDPVNAICPIITYDAPHGARYMWMGDLPWDMQREYYEQYKDRIKTVDILFAPHHGRETGNVYEPLLKALDPKLVVIGEADKDKQDPHHYDGYAWLHQENAGDLVFVNEGDQVHLYYNGSSRLHNAQAIKDLLKKTDAGANNEEIQKLELAESSRPDFRSYTYGGSFTVSEARRSKRFGAKGQTSH